MATDGSSTSLLIPFNRKTSGAMTVHPSSEKITTVRPNTGWQPFNFQEIWDYRDLLRVLAARDIKVRYKQTVLGFAWAIIQPFTTMVVFSIFFGSFAKIPSDGLPYPLFAYAALLPWLFFANSVTSCSASLVGASHLISKVYFPRLILPLSAIGANAVDFVIASSILFLMTIYYGIGFSVNLFMLPFIVMGIVMAALGAGTLLAALTATYRDFRFVVPFMVQIWMFISPVAYPASIVPPGWQPLFYLNPLAGLIEGFRAACLGQPMNLGMIGLSCLVASGLFFTGVLYFNKVERRFADVI
jgi:lipopolysaccharide transport system permease protein